jgi:hypothetical protein
MSASDSSRQLTVRNFGNDSWSNSFVRQQLELFAIHLALVR